MRRRTVLKLAQPISERRLAEQEWTWATEISSSPFSPICRPLAPVLSSLALHFAAGRPVRPEPRPVWLVGLAAARLVQVEVAPGRPGGGWVLGSRRLSRVTG